MIILRYSLWFLGVFLLSAVAFRLWTRRLYRDYPLFAAYIAGQLLRFVILFYFYRLGDRETYRHAYWGAEVVDAILKFGVICELFAHVFRPYEGIRSLASALLRWASVIFLLAAVVVAAFSTGGDSDTFLARLFAMERSVEIVQGGLLFLLFGLFLFLGLRWKALPLGIALGFVMVTSVNLAAFTLRARLGLSSQDVLSLTSSAGYDCGVLAWAIALYGRDPVHQSSQPVMRHGDVASWNRALGDFLRR